MRAFVVERAVTRPQRIRMVVDKGCLRPADDVARHALRAHGYVWRYADGRSA